MADPTEIVALGGGFSTAGIVAKFLWDKYVRREEKDETARDVKLDSVLSKLTTLELEFRTLSEKLSTQVGANSEMKARVEGISTNHGGRLGTLEQGFAELRSRIVALEDKTRTAPSRKR